MIRSLLLISLLSLLAPNVCLQAADLTLQPAEMRNLGIEFAMPRLVDAVGEVDARAYVIIPPSSEYVISSSLPGLVARVLAEAGEQVSAGQPLFEIRSSEFLALQQEYLESLHLAQLADAQLARDKQLAEEGIIAARRLEETRARAASANGRLSEHGQMLMIAGMRRQDLQRLETSGNLQDTLIIRAPIDGVVLARNIKAGESVDSMLSLCRMADLSELWLDIRVPRQDIGKVELGMSVSVRESAVNVPAEVVLVGQAVDPDTQVVSVRARLTESAHGLKPGQLVSASIVSSGEFGSEAKIWSVPTAALIRSGQRSFVFVRSTNGVDALQVDPVGAAAGEVQVRGLGEHYEVVVSGASALKSLWLSEEDPDS